MENRREKTITLKRYIASMLAVVLTLTSIPAGSVWANSAVYSERLWDDEIMLDGAAKAGDLEELEVEISHTISQDGRKAVVTVAAVPSEVGEENGVTKVIKAESYENGTAKTGKRVDGDWQFTVRDNGTYSFVIYYGNKDADGTVTKATSSDTDTKATPSNAGKTVEKAVIVEYEIANLRSDSDSDEIEVDIFDEPTEEGAMITLLIQPTETGLENGVQEITDVTLIDFEAEDGREITDDESVLATPSDASPSDTVFEIEKPARVKDVEYQASQHGDGEYQFFVRANGVYTFAIRYGNSEKETQLLIPYELETIGGQEIQVFGLTDVTIDETNFEDDNFREYVRRFDKDNDGILSQDELAAATEIELKSYPSEGGYIEYNSAKGIEFFFALRSFKADHAKFKTLDLSQNVLLEKVDCGYTRFEDDLDVSKLVNLKELSVTNLGTGTGFIDLSNNTKLENLFWSDPLTTSIDLSHNKELKELRIIGSSLTDLNVKDNPKLEHATFECRSLETLDLSGSPLLFRLSCCGYVKESYPDIPGLPGYKQFELKSLQLHPETQLYIFFCNNTKLERLQINTDRLTQFDCSDSELEELIMNPRTGPYPLMMFDVSGNRLPYLDLEQVEQILDFRGTAQQNVTGYYLKDPERDKWYIDMKQLVGAERVGRIEMINTDDIESYNRITGILTLTSLPDDGIVRYTYDVKGMPRARKLNVDMKLSPAELPLIEGENIVLYEGESYHRDDLHIAVQENGYVTPDLVVDDAHVDTSKAGTYQVKVTGNVSDDISIEKHLYVQVVGKTTFAAIPDIHVRQGDVISSEQWMNQVTAVYERPQEIPEQPWADANKINNTQPTVRTVVDAVTYDPTDTAMIKKGITHYTAPGMIPGREAAGQAEVSRAVYIHGLPVVLAYDNGLATDKSTRVTDIEHVVRSGLGTAQQEAASAYVQYVQPDGSIKKVVIAPSRITYTVENYLPLTPRDYYVTATVDDCSVLAESQAPGLTSRTGEKQVKVAVADSLYTVRFIGKNNRVIKTEIVAYGRDATPPTDDPDVTDRRFNGWNASYQNVKGDLDIYATYTSDSGGSGDSGSSGGSGGSSGGNSNSSGGIVISPKPEINIPVSQGPGISDGITVIEPDQIPGALGTYPYPGSSIPSGLPKTGDVASGAQAKLGYQAILMEETVPLSEDEPLAGRQAGGQHAIPGGENDWRKCLLHIILFIIAALEVIYYLLKREKDKQKLEALRKQLEEEEEQDV